MVHSMSVSCGCVMWCYFLQLLVFAHVLAALRFEPFSKDSSLYAVPLKAKLVRNDNIRGAIVLTLAGDRIPPYLDWSCNSIEASKDLFDMLIFHESNEALKYLPCSSNVRKIDLGRHGLAKLIATALALNSSKEASSTSIAQMYKLLSMVLDNMPYFLAEMKPATGTIFEDYLTDYTHWTYTDPDIIWGNLTEWISVAELRNFDIITLAKLYDAQRLFLRGQFALHKFYSNITATIRNSHMHFAAVFRRMRIALSYLRNRRTEVVKRAVFVSAEGSYSTAVFRANASVLIAGRMYSDRTRTPVIWQDNMLHRCTCVPYQQCITQENRFNSSCAAYQSEEDDINKSKRLVVRQENFVTADCVMGWIASQHQRCLENRYNDVVYDEGKFFGNVEKYEPRAIRSSAALFHFRMWEDVYTSTIESEKVVKVEDVSCFISYFSDVDKTLRIHSCDRGKLCPNLKSSFNNVL